MYGKLHTLVRIIRPPCSWCWRPNNVLLRTKAEWTFTKDICISKQQRISEQSIKISVSATVHVYRKVSNIRRTLVGDKIVDHSDVVGASPVGAAPTTSSFST